MLLHSLWKSQVSKGKCVFFIVFSQYKSDIFISIGIEYRRPLTADSAKTSMMDSDDNLDGEESN